MNFSPRFQIPAGLYIVDKLAEKKLGAVTKLTVILLHLVHTVLRSSNYRCYRYFAPVGLRIH